MRILLVGAGGVGAAFTGIAARRDFFELSWSPTTTAAPRDEGGRGARRRPLRGGAGRRLRLRTRSTALCEEHRITHVMNAVDPVFNMPIFDGAYAAGADYLDMAMSLSRPHPDDAVRGLRRQARRRAVRQGRRLGGRGPARAVRDRGRARPVRRVRAVRRRPPVLGDRRARHPRRRQPRRHRRQRQRDLRAVVLDVDHDRGVPQPAGDLGGAVAGTPPRRSASRRCSTSPRASGRSSASTSSTRRCC